MSTGQGQSELVAGDDAFSTPEFYLACFLRCIGYELIDLRPAGVR